MAVRKKTKANAGETLVEVVASIFLFLLMMGIMQGAISYSRASLEKNKQIREENARIIQNLQDPTKVQITESDVKPLSFVAVSTDFTAIGSNQVFTVNTGLAKEIVNYQDADNKDTTVNFSIYQPKSNQPAMGGGNP